ncbi:MAG TPA: hypothetical protein VFT22_21940, partial [Kofleriaceae bacterium]|nr:hypothetical protein [Kofleriaceae bacterium]
MAPLSGQTDVVPLVSPAELADETASVQVPDAARLVAHLLELLASEASALAAVDPRDERLADLNVRTALASWDVLRQPEEALRLLELAAAHPLAARLRVMAAVEDVQLLEQVSRGAVGALAIEIAEAWLVRHGDAERAAELADRALVGELPPAWRAHVVELAGLAHAARASWPRVIELRVAALSETAPPDEVAATAALVLDRADDARAALALCWSRLARGAGGGAGPGTGALGWLRCVDVALDAANRLADDRRAELLDRRAELIEGLPGGAVEALATRLTIAGALDARAPADATRLWTELAERAAAVAPGALRRYAHLRASWSASAAPSAASRAIQLAAHRRLADSECAEVAAAHAWRALELAAVTGDPAQDELARAVADVAGTRAAERWLDLLELSEPTPVTGARWEARGGLALRWAAAIAEHGHDTAIGAGATHGQLRAFAPAQAIELWSRAAGEPGGLPTTHDHAARLVRGCDDDALSAAYRGWASAEPDPRSVAALWCACGVVELSQGQLGPAEDSLARAAQLAPGDPFCRAALAAVYRAGKRHDQLAHVL